MLSHTKNYSLLQWYYITLIKVARNIDYRFSNVFHLKQHNQFSWKHRDKNIYSSAIDQLFNKIPFYNSNLVVMNY